MVSGAREPETGSIDGYERGGKRERDGRWEAESEERREESVSMEAPGSQRPPSNRVPVLDQSSLKLRSLGLHFGAHWFPLFFHQ